MHYEDMQADSAFGFDGTWQDFAKIALPNLLLTIVTLGIYRFWATTRERQYLWSHTRFVDERLEWTGKGKELFLGFVIVMLIFALPFTILSFVTEALVLRGHEGIAALLTFASFLFILYLTGLARYRALRYRLSRTRWRGIRGGSNNQGFGYGASYLWKTIVGQLVLGLLVPWSMTSLWNERWNKMSFGPHQFEAYAESGNIFARYLLFYLAPILLFLAMGIAAVTGGGIGGGLGGETGMGIGMGLGIIIALFVWFFALGLIAAAFYAKYYREVVAKTFWKDLNFNFEASTMDWIKLYLGDFALVVLTLGLGYVFLSYRHWKFFITHMEASGDILLDELTQSTTATSKHGEGLLDAFDIGAI
ncbi:YjgN family protein [Qipengyuania aquimaris]|uniref:YjgN family protein n=1 Tax=Qipengyuania aquimaris TaxID=255984 RepID=UPI001FD0E582|nr:YjgN family protein [Qipengyuania aquimaris]UOR16038.1 YjgN family protein [Qipengyuania aquimaris]